MNEHILLLMLEQVLLQQLLMMRKLNIDLELVKLCEKQVHQLQDSMNRVHE